MSRAYPSQDRISAGSRVPKVTVGRVGRALREATPPLWIKGGSGPGTGEHADNTQLVNLLVGVAAADPIAASPRLVTAYREAVFVRPLDDLFNNSGRDTQPMLKAWTLGDGMDAIVDGLTGPDKAALRQQLHGDFSITLVVGDPLVAWVRWNGTEDQYDAKPADESGLKREPVSLVHDERLLRTVKLTLAHFEMLAELWADTKAQKAPPTNSILDLLNDGPGNESAASNLAKGQNAAALSDQSAPTELDGGLQPHSAGVRENFQPVSKSRAGRSCPSGRSVNYDHPQYDHHAAV